MMQDLTPPSQHQYIEETAQVNGPSAVNGSGGNMAVEMVSSPQESGRRASAMFADYNNMSNHGMYTTQWQTASAPPNAQAIYTGGQNDAQSQTFVQSVPVSHAQHYVTDTFVEGVVPRQGFDTTPTQMFRPINMPPASLPSTQGYSMISADGRSHTSLPGVSEVIDSAPRGQV